MKQSDLHVRGMLACIQHRAVPELLFGMVSSSVGVLELRTCIDEEEQNQELNSRESAILLYWSIGLQIIIVE